jgi:hypothetical protein
MTLVALIIAGVIFLGVLIAIGMSRQQSQRSKEEPVADTSPPFFTMIDGGSGFGDSGGADCGGDAGGDCGGDGGGGGGE